MPTTMRWLAIASLALVACASHDPNGPPSPADGPLGVQLRVPDGGPVPTDDRPVPQLSAIQPRSVPSGSPDVRLNLLVLGLVDDGVALAGAPGAPRTELARESLRENVLTVVVPSSLLATPGDLVVVVRNPPPGGGDSNTIPLHVTPPFVAPVIDGVTPRTVAPQLDELTVALRGHALDPRGRMLLSRIGSTAAAVPVATSARSDAAWTIVLAAGDVVGPGTLVFQYESSNGVRSNESLLDVAAGGLVTIARRRARSLVVDGALAYAAVPGSGGDPGQLLEAAIDGSGAEVFVGGIEEPGDLAMLGHEVAVMDQKSGTLLRFQPPPGTGGGAMLVAAHGDPPLLSMGEHLYFSDGGGVNRVGLDGQGSARLGGCPGCTYGGFAASASELFFASPVNGTIARIGLEADPSSPVTPMFVSDGLRPRRITVDASRIWIASDGLKAGLWRAGLDGEGLVRVAADAVSGLAADGDGAFWTTRDKLYRQGPGDPAPVLVAEAIGVTDRSVGYGAVALSRTHVVWSSDAAVLALPRSSAGVGDHGPGIITTGGCGASAPIALVVGAPGTEVFPMFARVGSGSCPGPPPATVRWTVDDPALARVSSIDGVARVTALAVGTTAVHAEAAGFSASATLRMRQASGAFLADQCTGSSGLTLSAGSARDVHGFLGDSGQACVPYALDLTWFASNPSVIRLDPQGARATLTALGPGSSIVSAQGPGFSAHLEVVVP